MAGLRPLLDIADAYCLDDADTGHNEPLIASALAEPSPAPIVATKGGLTRPAGRWVPNGSAKHLRAACDASPAAIGLPCLDLYQLHAVDPQTPLATSVRALAALREKGKVDAIGLCNVTVSELRDTHAIAPSTPSELRCRPLRWRRCVAA